MFGTIVATMCTHAKHSAFGQKEKKQIRITLKSCKQYKVFPFPSIWIACIYFSYLFFVDFSSSSFVLIASLSLRRIINAIRHVGIQLFNLLSLLHRSNGMRIMVDFQLQRSAHLAFSMKSFLFRSRVVNLEIHRALG